VIFKGLAGQHEALPVIMVIRSRPLPLAAERKGRLA